MTDDADLAAYGTEKGHKAALLEDVAGLPEKSNCVVLLQHNLVSRDIRRKFRGMGALVVPIRAFEGTPELARYTLDKVIETDYGKACELNRYWTRSIERESGDIVFDAGLGPGAPGDGDDRPRTHLVCRLADKLSANTWLTPEITVDKWVSVGAYCELSITAPSTADWTGAFSLDGTAVCAGVLVAQDSRCTDDGEARIQQARALRDEMAACGEPVVLRLKEGVLTSCTAGDQDFTERVKQATNPKYDLHALELGIGTNLELMPRVDWRLNSQMNEGAGPVHIGFGEGITGAHMDFIVAEGGHEFSKAG
ncbi:hypothetical protein [Nonomuraea sp. CA-218870]|uniref:hypothetical protein n=1 Tax=Nonomuraea sp. CA-218870 TaxID=3239998 RepID=UPI003D8CFE92